MDALQAIVLGIVQGLTEFLPISSSGHLRIVPALFGWDDPGAAFTAVVQLGTMAAVLIYFRLDLWRIGRAWLASLRDEEARRTLDARLGWYILLGTIPISVIGLLFADPIEHEFRNLYLIGTTLIVFGALMWWADAASKRVRQIDSLNARDGLWVGIAQALALVPGVSRSGATISAGLVLGLTREAAARFSFLLSVPAVVLSGMFQLRHIGEAGAAPASATVIAVVLAFVSGYASIAFLLRYLTRHGLGIFVGYRFVVGALVIALAATGTIA
ncbi:MAG TPA: undecaprenyl-diphosphate phosphatase [Conexibacter sp.]|nr:undecaprenyl-diphosphate phosphatase [Conexibacter sp.]